MDMVLQTNGVRLPSLRRVLEMKMNEFFLATSAVVHFPTLEKWIKAISEVQADVGRRRTHSARFARNRMIVLHIILYV